MSALLPVNTGRGGGGVIGLQINMIHGFMEKLQTSSWTLNSTSVHYAVVIDIAICSQWMQLQIHLGRSVIRDFVGFLLPFRYLNGFANETWLPFHYPWVPITSTPAAPITVPATLMVLASIYRLIGKCPHYVSLVCFSHSTQEWSESGYKLSVTCAFTVHAPWPWQLTPTLTHSFHFSFYVRWMIHGRSIGMHNLLTYETFSVFSGCLIKPQSWGEQTVSLMFSREWQGAGRPALYGFGR